MAKRGKATVKDKGWNKILAGSKKYRGLKGLAASVGVQGTGAEETKDSGVTNVLVATVHEFGCPSRNIPQRSFIGSTFEENVKTYERELARIAGLGAEGEAIEGELLLLGERYRGDIVKKINSDIPPMTQRQERGSPEPALIDTGQLRDSISTVVGRVGKLKGG